MKSAIIFGQVCITFEPGGISVGLVWDSFWNLSLGVPMLNWSASDAQ